MGALSRLKNDGRLLSLLCAMAVVVAWEIWFAFGGRFDWSGGGLLADSDCYMRLERVLNLFHGGDWFNSFEPRTNAPDGEQLHWTRPLDALLYTMAWLGSAVTDFRSSLWISGLLVSPLLFLVTVVVWRWGVEAFLTPRQLILSVALMCMSPVLAQAFAFGRPDHHGLIALCQAGSMAGLFRMLAGDWRPRVACYAGAWAALGIWVSVESLAPQGIIGIILAVLWVWRGGREAEWLANFCAAMALGLCLALVIEYRPGDWFHVRYARFTIVDVVLAGLCAAAWRGIALAARRGPWSAWRRFLAVCLAAELVLGVMALAFPDFLRGPMIDYSERARLWTVTVGEMQPLWPLSGKAAEAALILIPNLLGLGWCAAQFRRSGETRRPLAVALALGNLLFLALAVSAMRWGAESGLWEVLPWTLLAARAWRWPAVVKIGQSPLPLRSLPLMAVLAVPMTVAAVCPANDSPAKRRCDWVAAAPFLSQWPAGTIALSYVFEGGEIIWRTPLNVVAAPYQNDPGMSDAEDVLAATDDARAQTLLARHAVSLVIVCPGTRYEEVLRNPDGLHRRLIDGRVPSWLEPVSLPPGIAGKFLMFRPRLASR